MEDRTSEVSLFTEYCLSLRQCTVHQLSSGCSLQACILNYKRDGTPFWNQLLIAPMTDDSGAQIYLLGIQADVSDFLDQAQSGREPAAEALQTKQSYQNG